MDASTAQRLSDITSAFYREHGASFSQTRKGAWPGWKTCFEALEQMGFLDKARRSGGVSVFDMACGNLRFEAYAARALSPLAPTFYAVDNCDGLVCDGGATGGYDGGASGGFADAGVSIAAAEGMCADGSATLCGAWSCTRSSVEETRMDNLAADDDAAKGLMNTPVHYRNVDVLETLRRGVRLHDVLEVPPCDLSVAFGFMHHVSLFEERVAVLRALVDQTRPGGYVVVSFWRFMHDAAFAAKARAEHERAMKELDLPPLDEGDFVLGWQNKPGAFRYCHHFEDAELDRLVAALKNAAREVARFYADGRTGEMNAYVILQAQ